MHPSSLIRPMLATAGEPPPPESAAAWAVETKWDGVRAIAYLDTARPATLMSRSGRSVTVSYPELADLDVGIGDVVLDGEIVVFDRAGVADFEALQARMHIADAAKARRLAGPAPVDYLVFDVLRIDGHDVVGLPYDQRRALLERLDIDHPRVRVPPRADGTPQQAFASGRALGLEGIVCKRLDSPYLPGRRSSFWIKAKYQRMQEVVIGGWEPGQGRRAGAVGALLLGVHVGGQLRYAGQVGTGFTDRTLAELHTLLEPLHIETSPFDDEVPRAQASTARWVRPELVGEVTFGMWTRDGRLRHPSWRGLRDDKSPDQVVRE